MRATCLLMSPLWFQCRVPSLPRRSRVVVLSSSLIGVCVHLCTSVLSCLLRRPPAGFPVAPSDGSPAGSSVDPVSGDSTPVSGFVVSAPVLAIGGVALFLLLAALSVAVVRRWRQRGKHVL